MEPDEGRREASAQRVRGFIPSVARALVRPEEAVNRTVLGSLAVIVTVSNLLAFGVFRVLGVEGGIRSFSGFVLAFLVQETSIFIFLGLVLWLRLRSGRGVSSPAAAQLPRLALTGLLAGPAVFLLNALLYAFLESVAGVRQTQLEGFLWVRATPPGEFLVLLILIAVVTPLAEEWYFRGFVFRAYLASYGAPAAYLVSAVIFALVHLNLPAAPVLFVLGLVLAWLYQRTGSLLPGMVAHGMNNAVAFVALYTAPSLG